MRKSILVIIIAVLFLSAIPALANYVFNPFTQKLDRTMYGENAVFLNATATQFCLASSTCITSWSSVGGSYVRNSYSSRFSELVNVTNTTDALDQIFKFTYVAPVITLSAIPGATTKEFGDPISSVALSALTVKTSNPITGVSFYRGASDINNVVSPNPNGGTETYTESNQVSSTVTFTAKVGDGTSTTTSNGITYNYIYPYYWGVGAVGLTCSQVQALTKSVSAYGNKSFISSPSNQVYYFAYKSSYGNLSSILDTNGFETLPDWTKRTVTCTMLDSTNQSYYIYEFNNLTTQTSFTNSFVY